MNGYEDVCMILEVGEICAKEYLAFAVHIRSLIPFIDSSFLYRCILHISSDIYPQDA